MSNYIQGNENNISYKLYLESIKIKIYKETKKYLILPINYEVNSNSSLITTQLVNDINSIEKIDNEKKANIKLRDGMQKECIETIINNEKTRGIINLTTSSGKTVLSLYIINHLKMKTIIIVNKIELLNQWKERIKQYLPEYNIGIIQGKNLKLRMLI